MSHEQATGNPIEGSKNIRYGIALGDVSIEFTQGIIDLMSKVSFEPGLWTPEGLAGVSLRGVSIGDGINAKTLQAEITESLTSYRRTYLGDIKHPSSYSEEAILYKLSNMGMTEDGSRVSKADLPRHPVVFTYHPGGWGNIQKEESLQRVEAFNSGLTELLLAQKVAIPLTSDS